MELVVFLAILLSLVAVGVGCALGYRLRQRASVDPVAVADVASAQLRADAEAQAVTIVRQAHDEATRLRTTAEEERHGRQAVIQRQEQRLRQKEEALSQKLADLDNRERALQASDREIDASEHEADVLRAAQITELERVSGLTTDEAREVIIAQVAQGVRDVCIRRAREIELEAAESAELWARQIIATAIQRYASDQATESAVSAVPIPNEEIRNRLVGRDGRNVRALEAATGVELVVDEAPNVVMVTGSDPIRREIARLTLTRLVTDGRVNPGRIEEIVARAKHDVETYMRQEGEAAAYEAGVDDLHPEVVKMMGKMRFRTSYGQNQLRHSVEASRLAAMMAAELRADVAQTRRAAFLHDIGKVMTSDIEGPHHYIGADFVSRFGEAPEVCDAVRGHHDHDPEYQTVMAVLVQAADAISGRGPAPGARAWSTT